MVERRSCYARNRLLHHEMINDSSNFRLPVQTALVWKRTAVEMYGLRGDYAAYGFSSTHFRCSILSHQMESDYRVEL